MEPILHSFAYSLDYLREQIADVSDELLTAQADGVPNHPMWTIGHLVFITQEIGGVVGIEPWLGEEWASQFGPGSTAQSETNLSASFSDPVEKPLDKVALLACLDDARTRLTRAVRELTEEQLSAPFPDPAYADVFPTVRHALTQVLLGHTAFHIGQISVWRRAMKLAPMSRSYE